MLNLANRVRGILCIGLGALPGMMVIACNTAEPLPTLAAVAIVPTYTQIVEPTPTQAPTLTQGAVEPTTVEVMPTILPATTPTSAPTPLPTPIIYVVESGDTPSAIADRFRIPLNTLLQVNGLPSNPIIYPGDQLLIPPSLSGVDVGLPVHYVQQGETLSGIATTYHVSSESLAQANPGIDPGVLQVGQALFIPLSLGEAHYTVPGDTLLALAFRYNTSLDALLRENIGILNPANPDFVPVGVLLKIPREEVTEGYNCSPQPVRAHVIAYTIANGEKLFCLGHKFNLSITTLLYANPHLIGENAVRDGVVILVPPEDGALYEVTPADVQNGTRLLDIVTWYSVGRPEDVVDWFGEPVRDPLVAGQKLFIRGTDLLAESYSSQPPAVAQATLPASAPSEPIGGGQPGDSSSPGLIVGDPSPADATLPPGALRPPSNPWSGEMQAYDTGYCGGVADGFGWTSSLAWPVRNPRIAENRGFRPGHSGIDIEAPLGTPVVAAEGGLVVWAGFSRWGGGNMVVIGHGNTWQTHYAHLDTVIVGCGQTVSKGELIGTVGQTGASSFPHLHLEVRNGGYSYDPVRWLP